MKADTVDYIVLSIVSLLAIGLIGLFIGAGTGLIKTTTADPCEYGGTGKTASYIHHGWITYGGRRVYCDGKRR